MRTSVGRVVQWRDAESPFMLFVFKEPELGRGAGPGGAVGVVRGPLERI